MVHWITKVILEVFFLQVLQITQLLSAQQCQPREYQLSSDRQLINLTSPNYPYPYAKGSNCRYRIMAPLDHTVELRCTFEVYPNTCSTEQFFISRDGDLQFRDGETFCRNSNVVRSSRFRSIALAYYSTTSSTNLAGRFFCQAYARRQACECGWSAESRITNGQETIKHEFPSMVALRDVTSSQRVFCGGSIVSHRHILTAAHCMRTQPDPQKIIAYLGDHDLSSSSESAFAVQHRIQLIINHPNYLVTSSNMVNDIAVLVTMNTIEWSRGVGPICLPFRQAGESFAYVNVDVAGWGTTSFAGSKSNTLQKVQLLTMHNRVCQTQSNNTITASQICTYDFRGLGRDSCQYDSGGPVIFNQQRMFMLGIISFGPSCGLRYGIGVNTRVTSHLNWVWNTVGNTGSYICVA